MLIKQICKSACRRIAYLIVDEQVIGERTYTASYYLIIDGSHIERKNIQFSLKELGKCLPIPLPTNRPHQIKKKPQHEMAEHIKSFGPGGYNGWREVCRESAAQKGYIIF